MQYGDDLARRQTFYESPGEVTLGFELERATRRGDGARRGGKVFGIDPGFCDLP